MAEKKMSFIEHIEEFRNRLRLSVIIFIIAFFVSYALSDRILVFLWGHFLGQYAPEQFDLAILAESVVSGFVTQLNLSLIIGATLAMPVFIYEMFMFIEPALKKKHKLIALKITLSASILFILGAAFVYYIMLPRLIDFFIQSNVSLGIANFFAVESFFEFIVFNIFIGGLIFQTPLIIIMANRIGILPKEWLVKSRSIVYVAILFIAGLITPDHSVISQLVLGVVVILLFEISLLFSR